MSAHEADYEWDGMWTAVRCSCDDFYRICESREVAEREQSNHLDDLVEQWHMLPDNDPRALLPLHEFLGMTWEEYGVWLTAPGLAQGVPDRLGVVGSADSPNQPGESK